MNREQVLNKLREHKAELQKKYPVKSLALFGSFARGEQTDTSDIDVLVEFSEPVGFEFVDLVEDLETIFNQKVDVISKGGLRPRFAKQIQNDLIYV